MLMHYLIVWSVTIVILTLTHHVGLVMAWGVIVSVLSGWGVWRYINNYRNRSQEAVQLVTHKRGKVREIGWMILTIFAAVCVVGIYDRKMRDAGTISGVTAVRYRVSEYGRSGRYTLTAQDFSEHRVLLRSTQSLELGEIVQLTRPLYPLDIHRDRCLWDCSDILYRSNNEEHYLAKHTVHTTHNASLDIRTMLGMYYNRWLSSRQSGQEMDNGGFNYHRWLYMQGISAIVYDNAVRRVDYEAGGLLDTVRRSVYEAVSTRLDSESAALVMGMLIGNRSLFDPELYQQFVDSGLVHIIAVSGMHMGIVMLIVSVLFFWLPFYVRTAVMLVVVVGYAMTVTGGSNVIRAMIMSGLTLLALFPGRQISIWRSLAIAWVAITARNPYTIVADLGLLLSFGAILGIIRASNKRKTSVSRIMGPEFRGIWDWKSLQKKQSQTRKQYGVAWVEYVLRMYLVPSLGATVGIVPVLLYSIGKVNILSPFINVLVVPFVPLVMGLGMLVVGGGVIGRDGWTMDLIVRGTEGLAHYMIGWAEIGQAYGVWVIRQ